MKNKTGKKLKFDICWSLSVQYIPENARHRRNSYYQLNKFNEKSYQNWTKNE